VRLRLSFNEQNRLLFLARHKLGSDRKLAKFLGTSKASVYDYERVNRTLPESVFDKLADLTGYRPQFQALPENWGRVKGGKSRSKSELAAHLATVHGKALLATRNWHASMKREHLVQYYESQHAKFKAVAGYKFHAKRGHKVRNEFEKRFADCLYENGVDYEYEPRIDCDGRTFFPDFKIGNLLVECTAWRGCDKARKLAVKLAAFEESGYDAVVVVPHELRAFYKSIEPYLVSDFNQVVKLCPGSSAIPPRQVLCGTER